MKYQITPQSIDLIRKKLLPVPNQVCNAYPTVYAMAGIPGAGKTTFVNKMLNDSKFPQNAFILSPDQVMELLPEYQNDYTQLGSEDAFRRWEMPARSLAYQLMEEAAKLHIDIIQDMSNSRIENMKKLERLKKRYGYFLKMYWIETPVDIALERINKNKRFTPPNYLLKRSKSLNKLKPQYEALVDEFHLIYLP